MTDLTTLLARIEAAEGPDRELDGDITVAMHGGEIVWEPARYTGEVVPIHKYASADHVQGFAREHVPLLTASLDAALALVEAKIPDAGEISITRHPRRGHVKWEGEIEHHSKWTERGWTFTSDEAVNAPLAILAALLRALIKAEKLDGVG